MQMEMSEPAKILKKRLTAVGIDSSRFAHKSFRIGMACQVLENQRIVRGGKDGVPIADCLMVYLETVGRWTNSE